MTEKTLAAVLVAPREFEMRELDLPEIADDAALLKIEACGICGSDIHGSERLRQRAEDPRPRERRHHHQIGKQASDKWRWSKATA